MRRLLTSFLLLSVWSLWAQEAPIPVAGPQSPQDTDILLPEVVVDLEEPEVQPIGGLLPDLDEAEFSSGNTDLPQIGSLTVDASVYAKIIGVNPATGGTTVAPGQSLQSIYTRGLVGIGIHQFLRGAVSIYQLGGTPELRLDFNYQSSDGGFLGTEFINAGEGLLGRQSSFEGGVGFPAGNFQLNIDFGYESNESGFQSLVSDYFGATVQHFYVAPEILLNLDQETSISGSVAYDFSRRFYGSAGGETDQFDRSLTRLAADLGLTYAGPSVDFRAGLGYSFSVFPSSIYQHVLVPELGVDWRAASWLTLGSTVQGYFDLSETPQVPFSLYAQFDPADQASIRLEGGYRTQSLDLNQIWTRVPAASSSLPESLHEREWYGALTTNLWPVDSLEFGIGAEFVWATQKPIFEDFVEADSAFPWTLGSVMGLHPQVRATWRPLSELIVSLGWIGGFLDDDPMGYDHELDLRLEFRQRESLFGGIFEAILPIETVAQIPVLGLTGWVSLADIVELELNLYDPLSLAIPEGRSQFGELGKFKEQGFRAEVLVSLSL